MAVKNDEMEQVFKSAPLMENEKLTDESQKTSNTRELLKKAREAANQKFAMTINKKETSEDVTNKANSSKVVLNGAESPAFHGQLIKTKLKRVTEPVRVKKSINKTSEQNQNIKQPTSASKSLLDFYKKVRAEYEDFREIEAVRLEKRLEKFSDFPKGASQSFEGK